jgi:acid stress-induced BolA-like protein IbaG/YrbA
MTLTTLPPPGGASTSAQIHQAISAGLPGAEVRVTARQPGHFEITVTSEEFRGKTKLSCQRLVYKAIGHLMQGQGAPLHAVDRLETNTP